jgi:hypothetical protein
MRHTKSCCTAGGGRPGLYVEEATDRSFRYRLSSQLSHQRNSFPDSMRTPSLVVQRLSKYQARRESKDDKNEGQVNDRCHDGVAAVARLEALIRDENPY